MLTLNELVFTFGILTSVLILVKIDQEMRPASAHRRIHRYTDTLIDANRFYNLSHAICCSYGADNKNTSLF